MIGLKRYLVRMGVFLAVVAVIAVYLMTSLQGAFMANAALNGTILGVLLIGIIYNFRQVLVLRPDINWMERYRTADHAQLSDAKAPSLLAQFAALASERKGKLTLTTPALRSILDGIGSRLEESRDISRYMIGLLIFLGLLGTFWGLLQTINAVAGVIGSLSIGSGDMSAVFNDLTRGLKAPLSGMGTAFSSSLFGLSGSLVLGFLDLQAGQSQNRFYNGIEDWLSGITRHTAAPGAGAASGGGEPAVPAYIEALLEQTAESMESLQRTIAEGEESRTATNANVQLLAERLESMTGQMSQDMKILAKTIAALAAKGKV